MTAPQPGGGSADQPATPPRGTRILAPEGQVAHRYHHTLAGGRHIARCGHYVGTTLTPAPDGLRECRHCATGTQRDHTGHPGHRSYER